MVVITSEIFDFSDSFLDKEVGLLHVRNVDSETEDVMMVVSGIHLECDSLHVVVLLDQDIQILAIFALHYSEPMFVRVANSMSQLVTSIFRNFLLEFSIVFWSDQFSFILSIINYRFDMSVTGDQILELGVQVISSAICLESFGGWSLVQHFVLIGNDVLNLFGKSSHWLRLCDVVGEAEDLNLVFSGDL